MVSMCGQIAGAVTASLTPYFASIYGWDYAFTVAAGVTFASIIPWFLVHSNRRLGSPGNP
jgi:ACS family glucarate transporter-like MFS transporter